RFRGVGKGARGLRPVLLLLLILLTACSSYPHQPLRPATPVPTATPRPIQLPADDAPHANLTEWWYYTGHLATASGQQYGFEYVIFQIERAGAPEYYAAHFAITDHQRSEFHYDQQTWTREAAPTSFNLGNGSWTMRGSGNADLLVATMPSYGIQIQVTPQKPPALHGTNGVVSFGPVGDSYYYSDTRMSVSGTVTDHGSTQPVTGEAWKDRQWGNFLATQGGGWDWFSVQLSDGREVMLFLLRGALGEVSPAYGTLVSADGKTTSLPAGAARVTPTGQWTSPASHATYPMGWTVDLPSEQLQITLSPVLKNQELDATKSTGQIYWEGEATIAGTASSKPIGGKGYVEMTGYAPTGPVIPGQLSP
ncbi:MAG TPA: lipocalin family protein, partial [Chloroflexota bacterium]|nr:lipocalin family protein [Chloroflexota bacterium]